MLDKIVAYMKQRKSAKQVLSPERLAKHEKMRERMHNSKTFHDFVKDEQLARDKQDKKSQT